MHIPVLQKEVLECLDPSKNKNYIDCTLGEGGHTLGILEKILPKGKVLSIDWDPVMIDNFKNKSKDYQENIIIVCDNFSNLKNISNEYKFKPDGILFARF